MRKRTQVAVTLILGTPDSGRGLESTGKNALVLQSVEQQSRNCDLVGSRPPPPPYQNSELRPSKYTHVRETGKLSSNKSG